jgi:magnesium-transporting ATPase (P-type)
MDSPFQSTTPTATCGSITGEAPVVSNLSQDSTFDYDEHLIDLDELERRLSTSRTTGLSMLVVQQQQQQHGLNILPTDVEAGHGAIHELVAVLRDGVWLHTRAENLLPGDIISLQPDQCVPADVRVIESDDMWISQRAVNGSASVLKLDTGCQEN